MSETNKARHLVLPYIPSFSVVADIGFGGDPVVPWAVGIDLPTPYSNVGKVPVGIPCDVSKGIPVEDDHFDVVYSSHLIEDFLDTKAILREFIRILKPGGPLILLFPDQKVFEDHCRRTGQSLNANHKIPEMGAAYMREQMDQLVAAGDIKYTMLLESNCDIDYNVLQIYGIEKLTK